MGEIMTSLGIQSSLTTRFRAVREHTEHLVSALTDEDQCVQSMPDAFPAKWHRAHTTWFFEQFILIAYSSNYEVFDQDFCFLFNSYYETVGARQPRPTRGLMTRPGAREVGLYRQYVDEAMVQVLADPEPEVHELVALGLAHEQQHQELLVTDMMHAFAQSPLLPAVLPGWREPTSAPPQTDVVEFAGGAVAIGHDAGGFSFDNEEPTHNVLLRPFRLANRLVRNRDWLAFLAEGGYRKPTLWMADGWAAAQAGGWTARFCQTSRLCSQVGWRVWRPLRPPA